MSHAENLIPEEFADEEIPILDFGPYLAGEDGALEALAAELRHAQENVGFYFAVNHGVPRELIERAHGNLKRFFDLPDAEKRKHENYVPPKSTIYVSSTVNKNSKPDLNEMLRIVRERPTNHPAVEAGLGMQYFGPNQWPDEGLLPGWKAEMLEYYNAMEKMGERLLPLYARALDLPADYFDGMFDDPLWTTRNQHYPAADGEEEDNQFGIAPHRDHGFITLLPVTDTPGLQIRTQSGRWLPANWVEGAIIINTGEFLNRWTNGRFMATPHRVIPPKHDRYSLAFFYSPTWDTVAEPLPTCVSPDNPPRYKPVRFLDYRVWYVNQNYLAEKDKAQAEPPTPEESPYNF
jgi:isopenicillin N synthase-like dioxygenase